MRVYYTQYLNDYARRMHNNPTKSEAELWRHLKGDQLLGVDFHRQKPIGKYIADFYSHDVLLVIEVDGASHNDVETKLKDVKKTEYIERIGIPVLRFTDEEVLEHTSSVLQTIREYVTAYHLKHPNE